MKLIIAAILFLAVGVLSVPTERDDSLSQEEDTVTCLTSFLIPESEEDINYDNEETDVDNSYDNEEEDTLLDINNDKVEKNPLICVLRLIKGIRECIKKYKKHHKKAALVGCIASKVTKFMACVK
ncbi:uncharacterized protein LOC126376730 [Pectinophora gossypiella]|uniref:uncharacterized protein LOC126376730 n=1 Tax=Pectinophora gossypiella TaxID=13191 RepID=UPI00214E4366|nr:uncharacterized protein LOC126376730 [Pectinophora gossypiella]